MHEITDFISLYDEICHADHGSNTRGNYSKSSESYRR
jgi:hypothetical protein